MSLTKKSGVPVSQIISIKAFLLYILLLKYGLVNPFSDYFPFLPFIPALDAIPRAIYSSLSVVLGVSIVTPLITKNYYQSMSLISGLIVLFFLMSSKLLFSNSLTFVACMLILSGLYFGTDYIFRIQIALLYFGAAINKFLTADWWNGLYMDHLLREVFQVSHYQHNFPADMIEVAIILGILVILIEFALGILVLVPKYTRMLIVFGLIFHGSMLVITSGRLSLHFMYIMSAAYVSISSLELTPVKLIGGNSVSKCILSRLDFSDTLFIRNEATDYFVIEKHGKIYQGKKAYLELVLTKQCALLTYFFLLLFTMVFPRLVGKISVYFS